MHLLWIPIFPTLLSADVPATNAHLLSMTRSCKKQILEIPLASKPVGIALLQASTVGSHLASSPYVTLKEEAITQDDSKAWSAEMHGFGRSSSNLMADLYMSQRRSDLSHAAAATWATTGSESLLEQAEQMGESSSGKDSSWPDVSSVTAALPSMPSLPPEPSTEEVKAAVESAPLKIEEAVVAAPATIKNVAAKTYAYQWTFLDMYCLSMCLVVICMLPCVLPVLHHIKVKTWRETFLYKILPLVLIMLLVPLQLVVFEQLGFLTKVVELAEPSVVLFVVSATILIPVGFMFYEILSQKLKPTFDRIRQLEQRMEAITGVDLDGDGEVASLFGNPFGLLSPQRSGNQSEVATDGDAAAQKVEGKQWPKKTRSTSQQSRPAKKGCLAC